MVLGIASIRKRLSWFTLSGIYFQSIVEIPSHNSSDAGVRAKKVVCGLNHVVVLTDEGKIWSWVNQASYFSHPCLSQGMGNFGQLGHGICHDEGLPKLLEALQDEVVVDVACGSYHTVCVRT